ncbi:hypothetical protein [Vagococcus fluvialis]|uniref:hypothetical protein n=1 Tax=Vagococcus fluvialis TaxID=2738 RepID=UPI001D0BDD7D|nr:hypothetical protein [Vagococcus fluvialis]UDM80390.1 hypothetical protein K5K97_03430 [Vagococcus fluvialis]
MSIQEDVKNKITKYDKEYSTLLLSLLQDIDDGRISDRKIKDRLLEEVTEWVLEDGGEVN